MLLQVDRRSLPRFEFSSSAAFAEPTNATEAAVLAAWRAVLRIPADQPISIDDDYFAVSSASCRQGRSLIVIADGNGIFWETSTSGSPASKFRPRPGSSPDSACLNMTHVLTVERQGPSLTHLPLQLGGNSLQAGGVTLGVRAELGIEENVPGAWLFEHSTVRRLAAKIDSVRSGQSLQSSLAPPVPLRHEGNEANWRFVLSFQQVLRSTTLAAYIRHLLTSPLGGYCLLFC